MTGRLLVVQFQKLSPRTRAILQTAIYGLAAGAAAVAFQLVISWIYNSTLVRFSQSSLGTFLVVSFVVMIGTSLVSGFLMNSFCREAAGSGIPQLKLAFWKDFGYITPRAVWVKFVAGALAIGGGTSLGREGPSVHLAGGLASNLAGVFGEPKQRRRRAAAAGAAAGLAAAFNAPLASFTFVLEEIIGDLNSRALGSVVAASVIGAFVVHGLIGSQPAFKLASIDTPNWQAYVLIPLVAVLAALAGGIFQTATLGLRKRQRQWTKVPSWGKPALGALLAWAVAAAVFARTGHLGVFALGYDDLDSGLNNHLAWKIAGILLVTKLFATIVCYGFGGCGGIFSPTLFLGGMCGILVGGVAGSALQLSPSDQITLTVVGMSACLGAVVRAPVTGILIVFEMTHQFSLVPALMLGALFSTAVGRRLAHESLYDALLVQDGHHLEHVIPPRDLQGWQQLPVSAIANFHPVLITDLATNSLKEMLQAHPYERFPVVREEKAAGILTRKEAEAALAENRPPKLEPVVTCMSAQSIGELQRLLIDSTTLLAVVVANPQGKVLGLITLHDLLRSEAALAKNSE